VAWGEQTHKAKKDPRLWSYTVCVEQRSGVCDEERIREMLRVRSTHHTHNKQQIPAQRILRFLSFHCPNTIPKKQKGRKTLTIRMKINLTKLNTT